MPGKGGDLGEKCNAYKENCFTALMVTIKTTQDLLSIVWLNWQGTIMVMGLGSLLASPVQVLNLAVLLHVNPRLSFGS